MWLDFFLEEPSMEEALKVLVPRILTGRTLEHVSYYVFQGKHHMLKRLPDRLRAYQAMPQYRVMIVVDKDDDDCKKLKERLEAIAQGAGLATKAQHPTHFRAVTRIAIEELEAWFFGDMDAVRQAYPKMATGLERKSKFRDPDSIQGGTAEQLGKALQYAHPNGLEKVRAARDIAQYMNPNENRSASFRAFRDGLLSLFDAK